MSRLSLESLVRALTALAIAVAIAVLGAPAAQAAEGDPEPGTPEYLQRDLDNTLWMMGRTFDQISNPDYIANLALEGVVIDLGDVVDQVQHIDRPMITLSQLVPGARGADVFRWRWEREGRGIMAPIEYENRYGARIQGEVWAPRSPHVDPVTGEETTGPYPAVVITTGSIQGYKELYWWAAQGLAEAGYVVMTYDVQGQGKSETFGHDPATGFIRCDLNDCPGFPFQQAANFIEGTEDALEWFHSSENPFRGLVDDRRIGLAGHSLGASSVTDVGNRDDRISAVVAWDNAGLPQDAEPTTPTMGQNAEAGFTPQPHLQPPDPDGKNGTYRRFEDAGVDAMQIALRGSTHLEWTYIPFLLAASKDGERVAMHYTLAWFDRWLKGERLDRDPGEVTDQELEEQADDARERLTAEVFDGSADASAIGAGFYHSQIGNHPYLIEGIPVSERLSFYYRSSYAFDGLECEDMRAGC